MITHWYIFRPKVLKPVISPPAGLHSGTQWVPLVLIELFREELSSI